MTNKGFNLSTYRYTDRRISFLLRSLFLLAALLFSIYNYRTFAATAERARKLSDNLDGIRNEISLMKRELAESRRGKGREGAGKEIEMLSAKIKRINAILERKGFSWSEFLYSLEKASPRDVSIIRIKPSYEERKIRLSGLAKGLNGITTFLDNLQDTEYIRRSYLVKEEAVLIDKKHPAVSFEIEAEGKF